MHMRAFRTKSVFVLLCVAACLAFPGSLWSQAVLRVAAVQTESVPGDISANLANARTLVEEAAGEGAELILLPELMPSGYIISKEIWDGAEPSDGPTITWLKTVSEELGVWLGTSFVEAEGEDFFNTFVLTDPEGAIAGRVRKQYLASQETFFMKGDAGLHLIDTSLGKIGVVICFEATLCTMIRQMHTASVDLVFLPTADPVLEFDKDKDPSDWDHDLTETALLYAERLGVPAVLANQGGAWKTPLPGLLPDQDSIFRGQSAIADSDGALLAFLGQDEGVIVADVILDSSLKVADTPPCLGRYCKEMPLASRVYQVVIEALGKLWYALSIERREKAREISSGET